MDIPTIRKLMELMVEFRISKLEFEDLKIEKNLHENPIIPQKPTSFKPTSLIDDPQLFNSVR